ncbi:hypothetical protein [Sphingobium lignivorans]|uniref:Uncharacterized protein n=1 Tax=Sphingobium lignivorans TaxID=2735886 RepID=A0ABR6NC83_9SPHN|nr:hypothetical protein [Sphingobium lignivorans]MBB5984896.1 hypothetical protein [Sphingobium lignivorans]
MSESNRPESPVQPAQVAGDGEAGATSRRQLLRLGAAAGTVVLTIQPGIAQAATSVLTCTIPVPDPARAGQAIAPDGTTVPRGTSGAFPGGRSFTGEDVRSGLRGGNLPGTGYEEGQAYLNYIRRLRHGRSGFTCYASLMAAR